MDVHVRMLIVSMFALSRHDVVQVFSGWIVPAIMCRVSALSILEARVKNARVRAWVTGWFTMTVPVHAVRIARLMEGLHLHKTPHSVTMNWYDRVGAVSGWITHANVV